MKYLKRFNFLSKVEKICESLGIDKYTINNNGSIDVDGNLYMNKRIITPIDFNNVSGNYYCKVEDIIDLCHLSPKYVGGDFNCSFNMLVSLKGAPKSVGGYFNCRNNQLTTLEGAPLWVGDYFDCSNNNLFDFKHAPEYVGGYFNCIGNPVYQVWKLFEDYSQIYLFNEYDPIEGDSIVIELLNNFLVEIGKDPVDSVEGYKTI